MKGWDRKAKHRMIMWNLRAGLSLVHIHHRCHKTSCCQPAEECGDGEEMESEWCLFLDEVGAVQLQARAAAGDRGVQHDWLHTLWKLSLEVEEYSRVSLVLSHVTVLCVVEYECRPSLTDCLGKCNGGVWDSKGLHFSLKLHKAAWNVSSFEHRQEVTSWSVMPMNYTQHVWIYTANCTPKKVKGQMLASCTFAAQSAHSLLF